MPTPFDKKIADFQNAIDGLIGDRVKKAQAAQVAESQEEESIQEDESSDDEHELERRKEMHATAREGGEDLYKQMLDEIVKLMVELNKFRGRTSHSALFAQLDNPDWQESFKKNFFKFYVDRSVCQDDGGHAQFNLAFNDDHEIDYDIVYGESFALSFLVMLNEVYKKFQSDAALEKPQDTSADEALGLLELFNDNLVLKFSAEMAKLRENQNHSADSTPMCGSEAEVSKVIARSEIQEKHGRLLTLQHGKSASIMTIFFQDFNHKNCAADFFRIYQEQVAKGFNRQEALCHLVDDLGSAVHLYRDANGRGALLLGWFEAITHDTVYPIMNYPYFTLREYIAEGKEWTEKFLHNPLTAVHPKIETMHELSRAKARCAVRNADSDIVATMLMSLFKEVEMDEYDPAYEAQPHEWEKNDAAILATWREFLVSPFTEPGKNIIVVTEPEKTDVDYVKSIACHAKVLVPQKVMTDCVKEGLADPQCQLESFDPAYVFQAVESLGSNLANEADLEKRHVRIAIAFMEIMASKIEKTELSKEQLSICREFILQYFQEDRIGITQEGERFNEAADFCLEKIPHLMEKSLEDASRSAEEQHLRGSKRPAEPAEVVTKTSGVSINTSAKTGRFT